MYYPKSQLKENLYTLGGELINSRTGKIYIGYYYSTLDGKYFAGKTFSVDAIELIILNNIPSLSRDSFIYKNTSGLNLSELNISNKINYPTELDYDKGYFIRYFIKRVNGGVETIKEVSENDYIQYNNNILYNNIQIYWKLKGNIYDEKIDGNIIPGVYDSNRRFVMESENKFFGLSKYIVNYIQYYRK